MHGVVLMDFSGLLRLSDLRRRAECLACGHWQSTGGHNRSSSWHRPSGCPGRTRSPASAGHWPASAACSRNARALASGREGASGRLRQTGSSAGTASPLCASVSLCPSRPVEDEPAADHAAAGVTGEATDAGPTTDRGASRYSHSRRVRAMTLNEAGEGSTTASCTCTRCGRRSSRSASICRAAAARSATPRSCGNDRCRTRPSTECLMIMPTAFPLRNRASSA